MPRSSTSVKKSAETYDSLVWTTDGAAEYWSLMVDLCIDCHKTSLMYLFGDDLIK